MDDERLLRIELALFELKHMVHDIKTELLALGGANMGKLSADGITAQSFKNYPKDWYNANVRQAVVQYTQKTGATMVVIDWKPDEGKVAEDNPGSIREWIMVSGMAASGEPLSTNKYFDRVDALDLQRDYTCCGTMASKRHMIIKKEDGKYYCPHCGNVAKIDIDTNDDGTLPWNGLRARIQVSIEKVQGTDDERNRIGRVIPIPR